VAVANSIIARNKTQLKKDVFTSNEDGDQIEIIRASSDNPIKDLEFVVDAAFNQAGSELENLRFEQALRALSHLHKGAAQMLVEVDAERIKLFEAKFFVILKDQTKSRDLAALLYLAIVGGYQALSRPVNPPHIRAYLQSLISNYLVLKQVT
jgi:hypothetical protein